MKRITLAAAAAIASILVMVLSSFSITAAHAGQIDVSYLQTCLKDPGSSLDVLVLMDSSNSLRDARPGDAPGSVPVHGSDPGKIRGKILTSSLKLLRTLAKDSDRSFQVSLRNFGQNSNPKELKVLQSNWVDWTTNTSDASLGQLVDKALYDNSPATEWTSGLATAKTAFKQRLGEAQLSGKKSCPVMFWITDGAPTDSTAPICQANSNASIDWFRENNILVLGGLLVPTDPTDRAHARNFRPIVTGENCGQNQPGWTRGEVIEANDVDSLAWGFIGLIASIKNLVNITGTNSTFYVDPSTAQIELFSRGEQTNWQVKQPDGSVYCSASNTASQKCSADYDPSIGITTITVLPESPVSAAGTWSLSPQVTDGNLQVYAGLNTAPPPPHQPKLVVTSTNSEVEEGKGASFTVKVENSDGTDFSPVGYQSIQICAKIKSSQAGNCKNGSSVSLTVTPTQQDTSVGFEAILVSTKDSNRQYRIAASYNLTVIPGHIFPSLQCSNGNPCQLKDLVNKNATSLNTLTVKPAENGSTQGQVTLLGYNVLSDKVQDRTFTFQVKRANGEVINWDSQSTKLSPGDKVLLSVSTDLSGKSPVQGVIKYKVSAEGKDIVRQLSFKLNVGQKSATWLQFLLLALAYLLTIGLPYLLLLWQARRSAVLNVPDGEFSFLVLPFEITQEGKVTGTGELPAGATFAPDYKKLVKRSVEPKSRMVTIENAKIEVIPPKWNAFTNALTRSFVPDSYILATPGEQKLTFGSAPHNNGLINEVILYFAKEGNISPVQAEVAEALPDSGGLDFLESDHSQKSHESFSMPAGQVVGNAIFIVSPYPNPEKALAALLAKLNNFIFDINLKDDIQGLREDALKQALTLQEVQKTADAAKQNSKKKSKASAEKSEAASESPISSDDDWGYQSKSENGSQPRSASDKDSDSWE
jgi:hypothetical protein